MPQPAYRLSLANRAVRSLMGSAPSSSYKPYDPIQHVPLTQPVWAVHPAWQSQLAILDSIG